MESLALTPGLLSSFKVTKAFDVNRKPLTSLCFDDTGDLCVTSAEDESLKVYDCQEGTLKTTVFSKKYGVGLARFTHQPNNVIYGSTKEDDTLRYLSLHDNKFIRYFRGHKKRVVSLEMSPSDDQFISSSLDGTVRLWDLRSPTCQGMINATGRPIASIDNAGLVFGVGLDSEVLRLYDIRSFDKGPFATWTITDPVLPKGSSTWTSIKFTNDGQHILITTSSHVHYLVHAFEGQIVKRLVGPLRNDDKNISCGEEIGLSPDARYAFAGGPDGVVRVWDLLENNDPNNPPPMMDASPMAELSSRKGDHNGGATMGSGIRVLGFNPSLMMMVSGGNELDFWEPTDLSL
ncbi:WD repeat domain 82-like protein [Absidia repens]|uniref:WD repeat domain 82-like protein n=1 Tax=Absidia repens TaxID=90262 RepID=A0A1X2ITL5_9FUNG|nr:WD repeat domain 82-like protein [Absidia repens]